MREIGLFPLRQVLLPGEQMPLHIFEPRYKELIEECLEDEIVFGLMLEDDEGMRAIGTEAAVIEVLDRFEDGRLNIVIEGRDRIQMVELTDGRSFQTAEVNALPDEGELPTNKEIDRCLAAYRRVIEAARADVEEPDPAAASISYEIAARVDFGLDVKQDLLELLSERERVIRVADLLDRAVHAVKREREIRERAGGNGRVEFR